jgi:outer membrane protein assembly factor BamE (lipoprotein component of BamABCDE complex)
MSKRTRVVLWVIGVGFVLFPVLGVGLSYVVMNAPPVSPTKADSIVSGMDRTEVQSILGQPATTYSFSNGGEEWIYSKSMLWRMYRVSFSPSGTVVDTEWDD